MNAFRYGFSWGGMGIALCLVWQAIGYGQEIGSPEGIQSEQSLSSRYPYVVEDMLEFCKPAKGFWIDLGAGKGQVAIPLIETTENPVVMLDPNAEALAEGLQIAREKGLESKLMAVVGVAEDMPFPDNSVDLVVSRGSIFFWDDPGKGLREVYRVLRPGGKAYIGGGAGSGYPEEAAEKLIEQRKKKMEGDEAEKWKRLQSHGEHRRLLTVTDNGQQKTLEEFDIKVHDANGKPVEGLPGEGGYFEIELPRVLFEAQPKSMNIDWIDFYRQ